MQFQSLTRQILNCSSKFNLQFATRKFNIKACNLQFCWNLQLLTLYSIFRNLPFSTTNLLTVEADRVYVKFNSSGVSLTIALEILLVFWQDSILLVLFTKQKFYIILVRSCFLLVNFLEDYELPKSTHHILSVPLILECVKTLSWSISFFPSFTVSLIMFCIRCSVLSELIILLSTHHVTNHLTCRNMLRWFMSHNLILKRWKYNTRNIRKCNSASNYILILGKLFYIYKLIHIDLKPRILIASFLLAPLLNK